MGPLKTVIIDGLPIPPRNFYNALSRSALDAAGSTLLRCGEVMTVAAKKKSEKIDAKMFDDVPVLRRKWQAALRPGEKLPRYEDVMLGSLGRLADHIMLLKDSSNTLRVLRSGRYIQTWLGDDRSDIPVGALMPDCATALAEAAACALADSRPHLA